jgi:hypothetical protein
MQRFETRIIAVVLAGAISGAAAAAEPSTHAAPAPTDDAAAVWEHQLTGSILSVDGTRLRIEARDKRTVEVDATPAVQSHRVSVLAAHGLVTVVGAYDAKGVLHAQTIQRAKSATTAWPVDR